MARMRANLLHKPSDCPFVFFAPDVDPEHRPWWEVKLAGLLRFFRHDQLARTVLAIEYFPYPSHYFGAERLRLQSAAQHYSFSLVEQAIDRGKTIVLTRGKRRWLRAVPALANYPRLCELRTVRKGGITPGNCDRFGEVVRAIERWTGDTSGAKE